MGDDSVILEGSARNSDEQRAALYSTVHGAGRVMSRTQAAGKFDRRTGKVKQRGAVSPQMMREWIPLTLLANSLNRSLGHDDAYPFAPSYLALRKIHFVHDILRPFRPTSA